MLNNISREIIATHLAPLTGETTASGCILWKGNIAPNGYGRVRIEGKSYPAHRASWVAANGPMPDELDACHKCDVRRCINQEHIFPGTRSENMLDAKSKSRLGAQTKPDRMPRGERHGSAKLTAAEVEIIRGDRRRTVLLATAYGVDMTTIQRIRRGSSWKEMR